MSKSEARAQMTMWAIVAAPLILGSDPRALSPATIKMLTNRQVIAVDQDPLGLQGRAVHKEGSGQAWMKPLAGGERAVALLNRGSTVMRITTDARAIGLGPASRYRIENLWTHSTRITGGEISASVPAHAAALYRVIRL